MRYYPVFLDIRDARVLVVGGGTVAQRKIETLLDYGADIHVVSRELTDALARLIASGRVHLLAEQFDETHLDGAFIVFSATDDAALNREVSRQARARGILINAVDQPADCTFIVPSTVRRGDLTIAVSTSGKSPALAKTLRRELETRFGHEYEAYVALLGRVREEVLSLGLPQEKNSAVFHRVVESALLPALARRDRTEVMSILAGAVPAGCDLMRVCKDLV